MKLIQKLSAVFAAAAMMLTLAGCGNSGTTTGGGDDAAGLQKSARFIRHGGDVGLSHRWFLSPFGMELF